MEIWGWLIGYAVLFALLHLGLYYVYVRRSDDEHQGTPALSSPKQASPDPSKSGGSHHTGRFSDPGEFEGSLEFDGETIECGYCGARNESDPVFDRCWNCVSTLRE
ncbi:hypothetical protein OB905_13960 [Halobacteria archaeon AArc-dxtr1]|nr:hypothetical protein [Halobacteria archaeon AArc-dxtr1]